MKEKDDDDDEGFGDKFTKHIIGSIAGFFMSLIAEYFYTRWIMDRQGTKKTED